MIIFFLILLFLISSAFSIFLMQVGYFGALLVWAGGMIYRRSFEVRKTGLELFLLLFVVAEIVSTIVAQNHAQALLYMQRRLLLLPIIYLLSNHVRTRSQLKVAFVIFLLSSLAVSLWSGRDVAMHFGEYLRFERRLSEFQIYMTAGGIMMVSALILLPFVLHPQTPQKFRWIAGAALVPIGLNLIFTFTRSSWLGFIGGAVLLGIRRFRRALLPMFGVLILLLLIASPEMAERVASIFDPFHPNNVTRLHMWEVGLRMFADFPLFGIGDIGIDNLWGSYSDPGWQTEGHLHNNALMWLVTLGTFGFVVMVSLFTRVWMRLSAVEKLARGDWLRGSVSLGALAVFVGFHINGLFEWNFGDAEIIMNVWAIVGLSLACEQQGMEQES